MAQTYLSDSDNYARCLLFKGHGYPLWVPKPDDNLREQYKDRGVDIGDVGIVTADGDFDFLFNICLPEDHPINIGRTPPGFTQVCLDPSMHISRYEGKHPVGSHVGSMSVEKRGVEGDFTLLDSPSLPVGFGASVSFTSSKSNFGLLCLPEGADRYNLRNLNKFYDVAMSCGPAWYSHANGPNGPFGRMAVDGSLYLVTGCDKSSSWAVASQSSASEECKICLKVTACQITEGSSSLEYSWDRQGTATAHVCSPLTVDGQAKKKNQCPFIRGFKISVRDGAFSKMRRSVKLSLINPNKPEKFVGPRSSHIPGLEQKPTSFLGPSGSRAGEGGVDSLHNLNDCEQSDSSPCSSSDDDYSSVEAFLHQSKPYHPSDVINKWLFDNAPDAEVAVTHDDVWIPLLQRMETAATMSIMSTNAMLIHFIEARYVPEKHGKGVIPGRRYNTSSQAIDIKDSAMQISDHPSEENTFTSRDSPIEGPPSWPLGSDDEMGLGSISEPDDMDFPMASENEEGRRAEGRSEKFIDSPEPEERRTIQSSSADLDREDSDPVGPSMPGATWQKRLSFSKIGSELSGMERRSGKVKEEATWQKRLLLSEIGSGSSGLERRRGRVEEATWDNQEETYNSEGEGDSSSFTSARSTWSSVSATFKHVGRAVRRRFNHKRLKKAQEQLRALESNADMQMLHSYRPLFPHYNPDPRLSKIYDNLCRLSGLNSSLKDGVQMIFIAQIELGETTQLRISLTRLRFQEMKRIISGIFQYFLVEWRSGSEPGQIWYPKHLLLDAIRGQFHEGGLRQVIHFLDFVSRFIAINQGMHVPICIPAISDIIMGFCLRYFIPNAFSFVDDVPMAQKDKDTPLFKMCRSVLDVLIGDIDDTDIVRDVWAFTVQLVELPTSKKANAQRAVNLCEMILDRTDCPEVSRLLLKLCKSYDVLPTSLFITGVKCFSTEATFGGGFSDIFRAELQHEAVALKRLRIFLNGQHRHAAHVRLCQEALIWKRLKHENILPFIGVDADSFPNDFCMVSPWMFNGTLTNFVTARGWGVDIDNLLRGVIVGLRYLHGKGIAHGDLRGNNILIDSQQKPRLADFGLAVFSESTMPVFSESTMPVFSGSTMPESNWNGSVRWMAPELHRPKSVGLETFERTFATDIYAFAYVCVEIYTGAPPFLDIREDSAVIFRVIKDKRPSRPSGYPGIPMPDDLWSIVTACWRQQPAKRPNISGVLRRFDHDYIGRQKAVLMRAFK